MQLANRHEQNSCYKVENENKKRNFLATYELALAIPATQIIWGFLDPL